VSTTAVPQIVVGVDGSEQSIEALRYAQKLAPTFDATIFAVAAWDYPAADPGFMPLGSSEFSDAAREHLDKALAAAYGEDRPAGFQSTVVFNHPAKALVKASEDAVLLIVGRRGHGTFRGLLLGSVSSACVTHAHCPVLVIREAGDRKDA
jgi:nucleotide-binding universal stress UspA family protein